VYVYAADLLNDRIQKFDGSGNVICSWTGDYVGDDDIARPGPLAVDSHNQLYVSDGGWIKVFDAQGRYQGRWGDGQVWPWDMAFAPDDTLYVLDGGQGTVVAYSVDGMVRAEWGSSGSADGQLSSATGIAVGADGRVYVSDRNNHRVQVFAADGSLLAIWQPKDETGANVLSFPGGIAVDEADNVYVAVLRVAKLDQEGAVVAMFGEEGDVLVTSELEIAADGTLYGIDTINQRINIGTTTGDFVGSWGGTGAAPGQFDGLNDIAISTR
jgi:DNA-binding beta-propeller fold protein YncE